jgi:CHAD domain-containing protein
LAVVVQKRLRALMRELPAARDGSTEGVHRSRVASRRMREALPLLDPADEGPLAKAQRRTRRITRAFGAVRELDVALGLLDAVPVRRPAQRRAIERVRQHLTEARDVNRASMLRELEDIKPERVARRIVHGLEETRDGHAWRATLMARVEHRAAKLRRLMDEAGAIYLAERLHGVRLAVKKLRYAVELAHETGVRPLARQIRALKAVQEVLGHLHDYEVLVQRIQEVRPADRAQADELDWLVHRFDEACRHLHGHYLARRPKLRALADSLPQELREAERRRRGSARRRASAR